jgi:hypothetical protein
MAIADTGCTGHYVTTNAHYTDKKLANPGISVTLPDGSNIISSHTASIHLPNLPTIACHAHIFPLLTSGSLISIGQLCDHGCTATFTSKAVTITRNGAPIIQGTRSATTKLWSIDISKTHQSEPTIVPTAIANAQSQNIPQHPPTSFANTVSPTSTIADRIAFYHASMFSPALSTWCAAIDAGRTTTFPGELTSALVRRHPPQSLAMIKGRLDQQRQNLRSTQPKPNQTTPILPRHWTPSKQNLLHNSAHPFSIRQH